MRTLWMVLLPRTGSVTEEDLDSSIQEDPDHLMKEDLNHSMLLLFGQRLRAAQQWSRKSDKYPSHFNESANKHARKHSEMHCKFPFAPA